MNMNKIHTIYLNIRFIIKQLLGLVKFSDQYIPNRELTFEEDFNSSEIDKSKWNTSFPWETHSPAKVTEDNLEIKNSIAKFIVKAKSGYIDGWWGTSYYKFTRPHLDTLGKFSQMYGRFECKAKVKNVKGLFPAFWTLTNEHINNEIGTIKPEIDVFEHFDNNNGKKQIGCSLHYGITYDKPDSKRTTSYVRWVDFSNKWAIYSVEWTKESIKWYINNELVKIFYIRDMKHHEIPTHPMFIIINEGVHEDRLLLNTSKLPEGMEVDWIRIYK